MIREIQPNETEKLKGCLEELAAHHNKVSLHFGGDYPRHPVFETIQRFSEDLANQRSRIAVLEDGQEVIAFCKIDLLEDHGKIDYLIVLEEYRKRACGRTLMDWAMQKFSENHISQIEVKAVAGNDAVHFYEKYGFQEDSVILRYNSRGPASVRQSRPDQAERIK